MSQRLSGSSRASRASRSPRAPLPRSDGSPRELWARENLGNGRTGMSGSNRSSSTDSSASSSSLGGEMEQAERRHLRSGEQPPTPRLGSSTTRGTSRTYTLPPAPLYTWWPTSWSFADFLAQNTPPGGAGMGMGSGSSGAMGSLAAMGPSSGQPTPPSLTQSQQMLQATLQAVAAGEASRDAVLDASRQAAEALQSARNTPMSLQTMSPASSQSVLYVPYASLSTEALATAWTQYASAPDAAAKGPPQPYGYPALYSCALAAPACATPGSPPRSATPPLPASPPTAGHASLSVSAPTSTRGTNATYTLLQPSFHMPPPPGADPAHKPSSHRTVVLGKRRSSESVAPRCASPSRSASASRATTPSSGQMVPLTASTMSPASMTPGSVSPCMPVALYKMGSPTTMNNIQRLTLKIVKDEEVVSQYCIPLKASDMPQPQAISGTPSDTIRTLESMEPRQSRDITDSKMKDTSKMIAEVLLDSNWQDSSLFKEDEEVSGRGRRGSVDKGRSLSKFVSRGITKSRGGTWQTYVAMGAPKKASQRSDTETELNTLSGYSSASDADADGDGDGDIPKCCLQVPPASCCIYDGSEAQPPPRSLCLPDRSRMCVPCRGRRKRRKRRLPRERCPGRPHILCLCKRSKAKKSTFVDKCCCARRLYMNKAVSRWDPRGQLFLKDEPPKGAAAAAKALAEALAAAGCYPCFCPGPPCPAPCAAPCAPPCWCAQPCCVPCCDCPQCKGCTCAVCVGQPPRATWVGPTPFPCANGMGDAVPAAGLPSCMAVTGLSEEERARWATPRAPYQPPCRTPCTRCRSPCRSPRGPCRHAPEALTPA